MGREYLFVPLALFAPSATFAQDASFARFVERTIASNPPPPLESITPLALQELQAHKRRAEECVPTTLHFDTIRPAIATAAVAVGVKSRKIKNGWTVIGRTQGCSGDARIRFLVVRMRDDSLRTRFLNEGESLTNASLMDDADQSAFILAMKVLTAAAPTCTKIILGPMRVLERSSLGVEFHGAYYSGSWSEGWTFRGCGYQVEVPMRFTPDGRGGAFFSASSPQAPTQRAQ